ncbi:unnamed protein product [Fusarium graminearum]|uniref:Uncharacterized protein n=1 Tax=Gibberella zeae TaxID=5518 RepID=A0A4E9EII0_GIBZA|nr:unnamed protein product [Fusarium graminearum]CAF3619132.1 unnamed protein product [Fusarium graminearum]CAG1971355.1 unnamed protein product [Fusarium graminearum]CAG1988977.1 unnamed protein product [Fusarium graminearum]
MPEVKSGAENKTRHGDLSCIAQNWHTGDMIGQGTCTGLALRVSADGGERPWANQHQILWLMDFARGSRIGDGLG